MPNTDDRVLAVLSDAWGTDIADLSPDALIQDLGVDSLDILQASIDLEEEFGIELEDDALMGISTVRDVVELVRSRVQEATSTKA